MAGMTTRVSMRRWLVPSVIAAFDQRVVELAGCVGDDQHLLKEGADDDDGDLRPVIDAEDGDRERTEGGSGQVAEELHEGFGQFRDRGIGAAENSQGHAEDRGDDETPEDELNAVPEAFMQPVAVLRRGRRGEGGEQGKEHRMRRRQVDRVGRNALRHRLVRGNRIGHCPF